MTRSTPPEESVTTSLSQGAPSEACWVCRPEAMEARAPEGSGLTDWVPPLPVLAIEIGSATMST